MTVNDISSAILNDLFSGNFIDTQDQSVLSIDQLEDEVLEERASIIKELFLKGVLNKNDVLYALNCVPVDCKDQNKCSCKELGVIKNAKHFEIPQLLSGLGSEALAYVGSTDRTHSYKIFYNREALDYYKYFQKYSRVKKNRPFVYIERTPNENGMFDGWIFNAPMVENITVIGVFQNLKQLDKYNCCSSGDYLEMGILSSEIKNRILNKKIKLYRSASPSTPQTVG